MYKDKDKQRESNKERQRRYRESQKGVTIEGVTEKALPDIDANISAEGKAYFAIKRNFELCRTCGELLPPLEHPRKQLGKCLSCVMGKVEVVK